MASNQEATLMKARMPSGWRDATTQVPMTPTDRTSNGKESDSNREVRFNMWASVSDTQWGPMRAR